MVVPGLIVKLKRCIVTVDDEEQAGIKAVALRRVDNLWQEGCTVAFMSRNLVLTDADKYDGKCCKIIELYAVINSRYKRQMSHRNGGAASFQFVPDLNVLQYE